MKLNFDFDKPKPTDPPNTEHAESESTPAPKPAEVVESTPFDKFDLKTAKNTDSFLTIMSNIVKMRKQAVDLIVTDDKTNTKAMEMLVQVKVLIKGADDAKKNLQSYKEASEFKNGLDRYVLEHLKKPLESFNPIIKPKINFYQKTQAELQRKKDAKKAEDDAKIARAEAEKEAEALKEKEEKERQEDIDLQATLNIDADNSGVERVSVPIREVAAAPDIPVFMAPVTQKSEKIETDHGTAKIESVLIVKVTDPEKVDRRYCSPDMAKLDVAVKCGVREIAGCIIEESFDPKIRLSKKKTNPDF